MTRPASIAACALARLSKMPRATNRRSARWRVPLMHPIPGTMVRTRSLPALADISAASGEPDGLGPDILAQGFKHLCNNCAGVEAGRRIHGSRRILIDELIRKDHSANAQALIEQALLGQCLQDVGPESPNSSVLDREEHF